MKVNEKFQKARSKIIINHPYFASLMLRLKVIEDNSVNNPTMMTDGVELRYNKNFVEQNTLEENVFWMCHEDIHCAMEHVFRCGDKNLSLFNQAADYVTNDILQKSGLSVPEKALFNPTYAQMTVEQVYNILWSNKKKQESEDKKKQEEQQKQKNGNEQGQGKGEGKDKGKDGKTPQKSNMEAGNGKPEDSQPGNFKPFPGKDGKGNPSKSENDQKASEWKQANISAAHMAESQGDLPGFLKQYIKELYEPKIPWRDVLHRFVDQQNRNDYTYQRVNQQYSQMSVVMPSLFNRELPPMILFIDTSGSVNHEQLKQFASEANDILTQYENVTLIVNYIDTSVRFSETFTKDDIPLEFHMHGGGGTKFYPAWKWIEDNEINPVCVIYMTDLECRVSDFGNEPEYPVLWIQTNGPKRNAPFGEVVQMLD